LRVVLRFDSGTEQCVAEAYRAVEPSLLSVRASIRQRVGHLAQQPLVNRCAAEADHPNDATHGYFTSPRRASASRETNSSKSVSSLSGATSYSRHSSSKTAASLPCCSISCHMRVPTAFRPKY